MSGEEDSVAKPTQSVTWRKLEASDFGILGVLTHLDAEISVYGGSATVRVNMISGSISNPPFGRWQFGEIGDKLRCKRVENRRSIGERAARERIIEEIQSEKRRGGRYDHDFYWARRPAMSAEIRAKRILARLDSYQAVDEDDSCLPSSLRAFGSLRHAKLVGIYWNNRTSTEEAILVGDVGLFLVLHDEAIFVDYKAIQSVDVSAHGAILTAEAASSKTEADGVLLNARSANPVFVPVRNGHGRYRDAFEFSRFVSRVAEDSKMAAGDLVEANADIRLVQRAS